MSATVDTMSPLLAGQFDDKMQIASLPTFPSPSSAGFGTDLKNKKRKRNVHELKAETIPLNDARRSYPRIFATMMNRCQTEDIAHRLLSIADPQSFALALHCTDMHDSFAPRVREMRGIDCAARFLGAFFQTTPDSIFVMRDYQFFKRSTSSQIHCHFELTGSIIYQMHIQNATCVVQSISSMVEKVGTEVDEDDLPETDVKSVDSGSDGLLSSSECSTERLPPTSTMAAPAIVGLDALAHVAELFINQEHLRQSAAAPTPTPAEHSPSGGGGAVLLHTKRVRRTESSSSDAAAHVPTVGIAVGLRPSVLPKREKRAQIGSTLLSHSKITLDGNHVTSGTSTPIEGGPAFPVINTALTSSKVFADKDTTFSLGEKVSESNGINYSCVGQVIFHVNPSKRVERVELIYHIDDTVPSVMSKRPPAHGLYSVPSVANSYDCFEGVPSAQTSMHAITAAALFTSPPPVGTGPAMPSALAGLSGIAGLAGIAGFLAKQDAKDPRVREEIPDILSSPANPSGVAGATPLFSI